jgi:UDP-3-O-[3-hydroxymyristoyl] glucosamine N-acyltransferase
MSHLSHTEDAGPNTLSWYRGGDAPKQAGVLIAHTDSKVDLAAKVVAYHDNPRMVLRATIETFGYANGTQTVTKGCNCKIHPSAVLGAEGQGYDWGVDGWDPFPHAGGLCLGDNVDVGPCSTIMRGSVGNTFIGDGTKIGNCVNIGHDTRIGKDALIIAHASVAGWVRIGDRVKIWQGAMIKNGIRIGHDAQVAMGAVVLDDIPPEQVWAGNPARRIR